MPRILLCFLLVQLAAPLTAHPVEHCLALVAQAAANLKACLVEQEIPDQCQLAQQKLGERKARCQAESFTTEAIQQAELTGVDNVEGDVVNSPFRKRQQQQQWERGLMAPNLRNFQQFFPMFGDSLDLVEELFHTKQCPKSYKGAEQRWLLSDQWQINRQAFEAEIPDQPYVFWFFSPAKRGVCYSPKVQPDGSPKVVNIPQLVVDRAKQLQKVRVIQCQSLDCGPETSVLKRQVDEYQEYFGAYWWLRQCSDKENAWNPLRRSKARRDFPSNTARPCPDYNLETKLLNVKGYLQQLDNQLFQPVTFHSLNTKSK